MSPASRAVPATAGAIVAAARTLPTAVRTILTTAGAILTMAAMLLLGSAAPRGRIRAGSGLRMAGQPSCRASKPWRCCRH